MPSGQRPELHVSISGSSVKKTTSSDLPAHTTKPVPTSDAPLEMATKVRMPSPASFAPHMPSQQIHLPPIFPYPPTSLAHARATPQRSDYIQEHIASQHYGFPHARPLPPSFRPGPPLHYELPPGRSPSRSESSYSPSLVPSASSPRNFEEPLCRKRSYEEATSDHDRAPPDGPATRPLPGAETSAGHPRMLPSFNTASTRSPASYFSSPSSSEAPNQRYDQAPQSSYVSQQRTESRAHRCRLYIRQQPRAARAGPDGKDRRTIDPPPVLQLQIPGFDPNSTADIELLQSAHWVVHCRLVSSSSPRQEMGMLTQVSEDGQSLVQRLLLGTYVSGPTFCEDDPDPDSAPALESTQSSPPSPSLRLMIRSPAGPKAQAAQSRKSPPGTFFIFADLSVRKAGEYRLEFKLMKMEPELLARGSTVPMLHSVTTDVFKVVNAKDFDQVQPSTKLVRGLLDRGAGFPLKLKKGPREGQARRSRSEQDLTADNEDDDDAEEY